MWTVAMRVDDGKEPLSSNAQDILDIPCLNLFPQVAFDELFDLAIGESPVQLYHKLKPPFGLRLWITGCSLLIRKWQIFNFFLDIFN